MFKRCIVIFPIFENMKVIEEVRKKYDPLAKKVGPHITLVFPFDSNIETDLLKKHMEECIKGVKPFKLMMNEITPSTAVGNYLFVNVKQGNSEIIELHKRLYTGILKEFYPDWLRNVEYTPHITVGNIDNIDNYTKAIQATKDIKDIFETIVTEISVEIIDINESSIIEMHIPL